MPKEKQSFLIREEKIEKISKEEPSNLVQETNHTLNLLSADDYIKTIKADIENGDTKHLNQTLNTQNYVYAVPIDFTTEIKLFNNHCKHAYEKRYMRVLRDGYTYRECSDGSYARRDYWVDEPYTVKVDDKTCCFYEETIKHYEVHYVRPVIEFLILLGKGNNKIFKELVSLARNKNNGTLEVIYNSLAGKDLSFANFSGLDLTDANFKDTDLTYAQFDSKEQLYQAKTYLNAKLPSGYWRFWSEQTKDHVIDQLSILNATASKLPDQKQNLRDATINLVETLKQSIEDSNGKYHEKFQRNFLETLHSLNLSHYPSLKTIVENLILFIITGGIGYCFAASIHYQKTGRFLFFNQTPIEKEIEAIDQYVHERSCQCI